MRKSVGIEKHENYTMQSVEKAGTVSEFLTFFGWTRWVCENAKATGGNPTCTVLIYKVYTEIGAFCSFPLTKRKVLEGGGGGESES